MTLNKATLVQYPRDLRYEDGSHKALQGHIDMPLELGHPFVFYVSPLDENCHDTGKARILRSSLVEDVQQQLCPDGCIEYLRVTTQNSVYYINFLREKRNVPLSSYW